jgi:hypothetical protein
MDTLQQILAGQLIHTPLMQPQDVYKLLFQAALGSEHAIEDEKSVRIWLAREISGMGEGPEDPVLDPISPGGQILRVHLRPYIQAGKDAETLLKAFVQTAREWHGSIEILNEYGVQAANFLHTQVLSFLPQDFEDYFASMEDQGFPAVHHSTEYVRLYRPAYRVVAARLLEVL